MTKTQEIYYFTQKHAKRALCERVATMPDRNVAEAIRQNMTAISEAIADQISAEYSFLELADIMEWKRTRVRR